MFQIVEYSYDDIELLIKNAKEISQANNTNANARLFLLKNSFVFKIYLPITKEYLRNVNNLLLLKEEYTLHEIDGLVLPIELVKMNGYIIGYIMPYIKGITFAQLRKRNEILNEDILQVFHQLVNILDKLPSGIHIGDLHENNILIDDDYKVHLIDIDGFSIDWGEKLTVPEPLPKIYGKYYSDDGNAIISKNSDIYCIIRLFINYISDGYEILESMYRNKYLSFLKKFENTIHLLNAIELLYNEYQDNSIGHEIFLNIPLEKIRFSNFNNGKSIKLKNKIASYLLRKEFRV